MMFSRIYSCYLICWVITADIKSKDFVLETLLRTAQAWCGRSNKLCICWCAVRTLLSISPSLEGLCWLPSPMVCAGNSEVAMEVTLLSVSDKYFAVTFSLSVFPSRCTALWTRHIFELCRGQWSDARTCVQNTLVELEHQCVRDFGSVK